LTIPIAGGKSCNAVTGGWVETADGIHLVTFRRKGYWPGGRKLQDSSKLRLTPVARIGPFSWMIPERIVRPRDKLLNKSVIIGEVLRGTLLERFVRHRMGCEKYTHGEDRKVFRADGDVSRPSYASDQRAP
jgi:hypothetical protein